VDFQALALFEAVTMVEGKPQRQKTFKRRIIDIEAGISDVKEY